MGRQITVTAWEGQFLFLSSENFLLPADLGEGHKYSHADQSQANREVGKFHKMLKKLSPLSRGARRLQLFGPVENYDVSEGENKSYKMKNLDFEVTLQLNSTTESGMSWVLLMALHPAAPKVQSAGLREDVVWTLAEKIRRVRDLEKDIGLKDAKPRRWKSDDEYEDEDKERQEKKETEGNGAAIEAPAAPEGAPAVKD